MNKSLTEMSDAEVLLDQAAYLRGQSERSDCLDPRIPIARAERFESIAAKLEKSNNPAKPIKMTTTYDEKKSVIADECAKASARPV